MLLKNSGGSPEHGFDDWGGVFLCMGPPWLCPFTTHPTHTRSALAGGNTLPLACAASSISGAPLSRVALVGPGAAFTGTATSSYIGNYSPCEVRARAGRVCVRGRVILSHL